jgi:hypothetical protein
LTQARDLARRSPCEFRTIDFQLISRLVGDARLMPIIISLHDFAKLLPKRPD